MERHITLAYLPASAAPGLTGPGRVTLKDTAITGNTSKAGPSNCRAIHAAFVSLGGNSGC